VGAGVITPERTLCMALKVRLIELDALIGAAPHPGEYVTALENERVYVRLQLENLSIRQL
jgi:hypothetical protein